VFFWQPRCLHICTAREEFLFPLQALNVHTCHLSPVTTTALHVISSSVELITQFAVSDLLNLSENFNCVINYQNIN
jgi:hypothetical protein